MAWTKIQHNRLLQEKKILGSYFPDFDWETVGRELCITGWMRTNSSKHYKIRLYVPEDVPNSVPEVVVISPYPLFDFYGHDLGKTGPSASMHILSSVDGYTKICHYDSDHWHPRVTFYKVLMKARLWLEAYEAHKRTGNDIDTYLRHQT